MATKEEGTERLRLAEAATFLLDECRMVLPGLQALFGFQLIAVFQQRFAEDLPVMEQRLHFASLTLVALASALVMMPAAYHRITDITCVSREFLRNSSRMLLASMVVLAAGLSLDYYVVGWLVFADRVVAVGAAALLGVFTALWFVLPRLLRA